MFIEKYLIMLIENNVNYVLTNNSNIINNQNNYNNYNNNQIIINYDLNKVSIPFNRISYCDINGNISDYIPYDYKSYFKSKKQLINYINYNNYKFNNYHLSYKSFIVNVNNDKNELRHLKVKSIIKKN